MHENGKVEFSWHEKKKWGSKKLVVRGVTHWIKNEDDDKQTNFFGRCNLYIIEKISEMRAQILVVSICALRTQISIHISK